MVDGIKISTPKIDILRVWNLIKANPALIVDVLQIGE